MQQNSLLTSNKKIIKSEKIIDDEKIFDNILKDAKASGHDKRYCLGVIRKEEYLWDLRCWKKYKDKYSRKEIEVQIEKWVKDVLSNNCGHAVYCMRLLLDYKWATMDEIIDAFLDNNKIKYADEIGSW